MKLLFALFLMISFSGFGQTKLDSILFNKINEYRVSKHLKTLKWDTCAYKATKRHTEYLVKNEFYSGKRFLDAVKSAPLSETQVPVKPTLVYPHREEDPNFATLGNRYDYYGGKCMIAGEVIGGNMTCCNDNDPSKNDKLATEILNGWKNSPAHDKILTDPSYTRGCGSVSVEILEQGMKGRKCYYTTSTFLIVD